MATVTTYPNATKIVQQALNYQDFVDDASSSSSVTLLADIAAPTDRPISAEVRILTSFAGGSVSSGYVDLVDSHGNSYLPSTIDATSGSAGLSLQPLGVQDVAPDNMLPQKYGVKLFVNGDNVDNLTAGQLVVNWHVASAFSE
jgi:hypothetical protein